MKPFYLNALLRATVFALVGIFTPIYLYGIGGMGWVIGYYLVTRVTTLLCAIPVSHVIEQIGFRRSIGISVVLLLICYISLLGVGKGEWMWVMSAVAGGLNIPFYWIARSSAVSQDSQKEHVGVQMGWISGLEQLAGMLAPLAAGLMIERWGYVALYGLAIVLLGFSVLHLWALPPHTHRNGATWSGFGRWVSNRRYFHNAIGIGARAVDDYGLNVLWPVVIVGLGAKTGVVGGIFTLSAMVALGVKMTMGQVFDRLHSRRDMSDEWIYGISAIVGSMMWLVRMMVKSVGMVVGVDMVGAIFGTTYSSWYLAYEQLGGKRMGSMAYWVYGEMMYSILAIGLFGAVWVGWRIGVWEQVVMVMASLWVLVSIVMARESNMR